MSMRIVCLLIIFSLLFLSGCQSSSLIGDDDTTQMAESSSTDNIPDIASIKKADVPCYPQNEFLFTNECFSFCRDMDYFLSFSIGYNTFDAIVNTYPPQIIGTVKNPGNDSLYLGYDTDGGTRVFVFFYESDGYRLSKGFPVMMKKSLCMKDFDHISEGDTLEEVKRIDPIAEIYQQGYDLLSDEMIESLYTQGRETISTIHVLVDGAIRINYDRSTKGHYTITGIYRSADFLLPMLGGTVNYRIDPDDYI